VVYRARALRCYEMSDLPLSAGFSGTYCTTSCEDCAYYREQLTRSRRVLVITTNQRLRDRLRGESESSFLELEFASSEYECASVIDSFRPELVVIDGALPEEECRSLCTHIAGDARIPGARIVFAKATGGESSSVGGDRRSQLPGQFAVSDLEERLGGGRRSARQGSKEVGKARDH
jgi:CheY-like chemotaxis protein